jgi:RNA polymerase sigma-70 factor (ECF subfamily)
VTRDDASIAEDRDIAERIAAGDEAAFVIAYDRHVNLVYGSAVRFLGDREAAAEVVQDAFMALWRRAHQYEPSAGSLSGWLLSIARHRAIDRLRGDARRPLQRAEPLEAAALNLRETSAQPDTLVARRWVQSVVQSAVAALPDWERDVVRLAYADGLSQSAIAERLDIPIGTVKSRTRRAMAHVRSRLEAIPGWNDADIAFDPAPSAGWAGPA